MSKAKYITQVPRYIVYRISDHAYATAGGTFTLDRRMATEFDSVESAAQVSRTTSAPVAVARASILSYA